MTRFSIAPIALVLLAVSGPSSKAESLPAEYAMRWMPSEGGPATAEATLKLLTPPPTASRVSTFKVRYFTVGKPADAPADWTAILRERVGGKKGKAETTWKYRAAATSTQRQQPWTCPLQGAKKTKDEIDVTFLAAGTSRAHSLSCTADGLVAATLVPGLVAKPKGCAVDATRTETDTVTVEEWRLGSGDLVLEVSWKAPESSKAAKKFKSDVASRLAKAGALALEESKTELASRCS